MQGRAALEGLPSVKQQLLDLQKSAEDLAGNLQTKALVSANTRKTMDWLIGDATGYADKQRTVWATTTAKNNIDSATNIGGLAIAQMDFTKLDEQMRTIGFEAHNYFDPQGYDDATLADGVSKYKGSAVKNWVETAATNLKILTPFPRAAIFDHFTNEIDPGSRLVIDKYIKNAATNLIADRLATHAIALPGRTEDTSLSPEMRAWLDTIRGGEVGSTGGYDTLYGGQSVQQKKPGYDYSDHPKSILPGRMVRRQVPVLIRSLRALGTRTRHVSV